MSAPTLPLSPDPSRNYLVLEVSVDVTLNSNLLPRGTSVFKYMPLAALTIATACYMAYRRIRFRNYRIQNSDTRLVFAEKNFCHITPLLRAPPPQFYTFEAPPPPLPHFYSFPPPTPHFYCFPSNTTSTTFHCSPLLHHHHHHIPIVFLLYHHHHIPVVFLPPPPLPPSISIVSPRPTPPPPPPSPHVFCFQFSFYFLPRGVYVGGHTDQTLAKKAKIRSKRSNPNNIPGRKMVRGVKTIEMW